MDTLSAQCVRPYEYWEKVIPQCRSCVVLCCRGARAFTACRKHCRGFLELCTEHSLDIDNYILPPEEVYARLTFLEKPGCLCPIRRKSHENVQGTSGTDIDTLPPISEQSTTSAAATLLLVTILIVISVIVMFVLIYLIYKKRSKHGYSTCSKETRHLAHLHCCTRDTEETKGTYEQCMVNTETINTSKTEIETEKVADHMGFKETNIDSIPKSLDHEFQWNVHVENETEHNSNSVTRNMRKHDSDKLSKSNSEYNTNGLQLSSSIHEVYNREELQLSSTFHEVEDKTDNKTHLGGKDQSIRYESITAHPEEETEENDTLMDNHTRMSTDTLTDYEVLDVLDSIDWCKAYLFEDNKIEVHTDMDYPELDYVKMIRILEEKTRRTEMEFRIKEYMPSSFSYFALTPGEKVVCHNNESKVATIGAYLICTEDKSIYAITAGHAVEEDQYLMIPEKNGQLNVLGQCVERLIKRKPPISFDLAVIKIDDPYRAIENTIFNSQAVRCTFRLPDSQQEARDMECWKVQRKAHGTWEYGYLRHSVYTNKEHGIYRAVTVVRAHELCPVIRPGECGSLVTSLPRAGQLTVYGMLIGRLEQDADDEGDPIELYIAFPFKEALEEVRKCDYFKGKSLELIGRRL